MGEETPVLCYKIWYATAQAKTNEVLTYSFNVLTNIVHVSWFLTVAND